MPDIMRQSTETVLAQEQVEKEITRRMRNHWTARKVIEDYSKTHDWTPEDLQMVLEHLGLDREMPDEYRSQMRDHV